MADLSINPWQSAAIAAGTAAATTLLLEYAAKPWLDVRKARILDETRAYREVQASFRRIDALLASSQNPKLVQWAPGRVVDDLVQAHAAIQQLNIEVAHTRPGRIPPPALELLTFLAGTLDATCGYGVAAIQEGLPLADQLERMRVDPKEHQAFYDLGAYLHTPRYRPIALVRRYIKVAHTLGVFMTDAGLETTGEADV